MTETIFILAATVFFFALFLLTFYVKGRSEGKDAHTPTCARCNCQRKHEPGQQGAQKQIEKSTEQLV
jgi:hypothetical protein